ncbi:MAG TPA: hypothetical protein VFZ52_02705, partial [Chryseolinea sp.]
PMRAIKPGGTGDHHNSAYTLFFDGRHATRADNWQTIDPKLETLYYLRRNGSGTISIGVW